MSEILRLHAAELRRQARELTETARAIDALLAGAAAPLVEAKWWWPLGGLPATAAGPAPDTVKITGPPAPTGELKVRRRARGPSVDYEDFKRRWLAGEPGAAIAAALKINYQTLGRIRAKLGLPPRPPGFKPSAGRDYPAPQDSPAPPAVTVDDAPPGAFDERVTTVTVIAFLREHGTTVDELPRGQYMVNRRTPLDRNGMLALANRKRTLVGKPAWRWA